MNVPTATIRELRTDFRSLKRKLEEHPELVITDRGEPAYVLKALVRTPRKRPVSLDYYARLVRRQPELIPEDVIRTVWEDDRGER